MSVFEKEKVVVITLSQPYCEDIVTVTKGNELDTAERRFLKEHILGIQPRKMGVTRLTLKGEENTMVWKGEEILFELIDRIGTGEQSDREWLVRNWETISPLILDPLEIEKHLVGSMLGAMLRDRGMDLGRSSRPIRHDRWSFDVQDENGLTLATYALSDTDDFPDLSQYRTAKGLNVVVSDGDGEPCLVFPIEEYLFLLDFAARVSRGDDPTEWNCVNDIIRSGATVYLLLAHYPGYLAFLRSKGWEEKERPEAFRNAVMALWGEQNPVEESHKGGYEPLSSVSRMNRLVLG